MNAQRFTPEFKEEAVKQVAERGYSVAEVAARLGVSTHSLYKWVGISKRGDTYLRTLLIAGARAVIARSGKSDWIERLLQRCHYNVVAVALANKMARTAWAVLTRSMAFDRSR